MTSSRRTSSRQQQQQQSITTTGVSVSNQVQEVSTLNSSSITNVVPTTLIQDETGVAATSAASEANTATEVIEKMSDDDGSDDSAITRCPCGKEKLPNWFGNSNGNNNNNKDNNEEEDDDEGLMVMCDQCEVWQHCKCVGLEEEKDIPDQYYCEQCRPENHKSVKTPHGRRYKRLYSSLGFSQDSNEDQPSAKPAKRKKRAKEAPGSRKSSRQQQPSSATNGATSSSSPILSDMSTDLDNAWSTQQALTTAIAISTLDDSNNSPNSSSPLTDTDEAAVLTRSRIRSGQSPVADSIPLTSPTMGRRKKQHTHEASTTIVTNGATFSASSTSPPPSSALSSPSRNTQGRFNKPIATLDPRSPHPPSSPLAPLSASPSTPTLLSALPTQREDASYWNQDGHPAREASPPAKIKYPTAKMTMADMNKRAKQIMDHLDKIKSALDSDTNLVENRISSGTALSTDGYQQHEDDSVLPISMSINSMTTYSSSDQQEEDEQRPRSHSTCSSISSASTLPLLLNDTDESYPSSLLLSASPTSPLPLDKLFEHQQEQESSLEMMGRVYRELLKFQRKFGGVLQVASSVR
ncbi:hypothetical protein [Absidia glauca]|uniref:Zinc finger PHD-type domain-containing protein n=1 Tax=Absidia glauca TaxID=4829 RepID=A0A168NWU6_ABSGL|nr:hypothetical protein [Absidia glauca]